MQERKSLRSIDLSGGRALSRRILFWSITGFATLAALGYVLPAHRVGDDTHFHTYLADGGIVPVLALLTAAFATYALRNRGVGAGIAAGVLAMGGAVLALAPVILAHFLSTVEYGIGQHVFMLGVLGLFGAGAAMVLSDPLLYIIERRRYERATMPAQLPVASIVTSR